MSEDVAVKRFLAAGAALLAAIGLLVAPNFPHADAAAAEPFKVLAFYNGTWDAAHIDFDKEAREWFPQAGAQNGFTWEATTDWGRLNTGSLAAYKVIMFLDDAPPAAQRSAFQQYMQNGGAWMGFHVSAFTTDPNSWSWYYNTFLGTGSFQTNTWGPTAETLKIEDRNHPSTAGLPATITSSVSEWYSWSKDLRQNPAIDVLASIDNSSFPVGSDPNQQWTSGFYPIMWTNKNYKMLYANFGHNGMNYETNTRTSSTFASAQQNQWLIQGILWLAGASSTPPSTDPISSTAWYTVVNQNSGKCLDVPNSSTADGANIIQYTCGTATNQQWQWQAIGSYFRLVARHSGKCLDVVDSGTGDGADIQQYTCGSGNNQQWSRTQA